MTMEFVVSAGGLFRGEGLGVPCTLGRAGVRRDKREGDGATPAGCFVLRRVYYRPDRLPDPPRTRLPVTPLDPDAGWCDDPGDADYNRPVRLPHRARCERLWREDHLYDIVTVLGHNDDPPVAGLGSAIFLHIAADDGSPTEGCVGLSRADLLAVLRLAGPDSILRIDTF
jgi:L,D-peptidoglycan transpeptidase YkuD (ErfK/YbiS/YcfS/YnhG family)